MNMSCTWMTILDCLFYAFDILSRDVSLEDSAKLVVASLYQKATKIRLILASKEVTLVSNMN